METGGNGAALEKVGFSGSVVSKTSATSLVESVIIDFFSHPHIVEVDFLASAFLVSLVSPFPLSE